MTIDCGTLILMLLSLASLSLSCCNRSMQQGFEPDYGQAASALAEGNDIVYEEGYKVQTVFDGSKIDVSIYGTFPVPGRDYVYAIDMHASQVLKIKIPLDRNRIGLVAGSADGETGHKDGWGKSSLFNQPKELTADDEGNIYVADVRNMVIRKINPEGAVSTIAGQSNISGFADGEGKEAHFSSDFGLTYISRICSLLVSDRGNRRLRLIRLKNSEVCDSQKASFSVGLEGLFFIITGTVAISTITVLAFQNATLREKLQGLQLDIADRLRWRHSGDDLYAPLQSGGRPPLPSGMQPEWQTRSLPANFAAGRLPDLIDLSYETPEPDVPHQTPRITDGADFTRGRVQDPAAHSEASDTPSSPATLLVSDGNQA